MRSLSARKRRAPGLAPRSSAYVLVDGSGRRDGAERTRNPAELIQDLYSRPDTPASDGDKTASPGLALDHINVAVGATRVKRTTDALRPGAFRATGPLHRSSTDGRPG